MDKSMFKMTPEALALYMGTMKKGGAMQKKKGNASYTRKMKHKKQLTAED